MTEKGKNTPDSNASTGKRSYVVNKPYVVNKHEPRLPKAATAYADALLAVQRARFEREQAQVPTANTAADATPTVSLLPSLHMFADSDQFVGAGWSKIGKNRKGMAFRWMERLGSLMLPVDLTVPRMLTITGCGYTKRRFLRECTLWVEDSEIEHTMARKGFNRWILTATIPAMPPRAYYLLRLQSPGVARLAVGLDTYASLAVNEVRIERL